MTILKRLFIDDELQLFTSNRDLHHLTKTYLFFTSEADTEWTVPHNLRCTEIFTQVFYPNEFERFETLFADSITHKLNSSKIVFSEPREGVALLVCPQHSGNMDWIEVIATPETLNLINAAWINRVTGIN